MTEDGLRKLKKEHDHLVNVERPAISRQIAEAREKGTFLKMLNMMLLKMPRVYLNENSKVGGTNCICTDY